MGDVDLENFDGHIEIESDLGSVLFPSLRAKGRIHAQDGSGIKADKGIEAGEGIRAGLGIEAGEDIEAGRGINAGWGIKAGGGIKTREDIRSGLGIEAGSSIKAGEEIMAGEGIMAGGSIKAGGSIQAQLDINCAKTLSSKMRIFAGLCYWRDPTPVETQIVCGRLARGEIAYGMLVEKGMPTTK